MQTRKKTSNQFKHVRKPCRFQNSGGKIWKGHAFNILFNLNDIHRTYLLTRKLHIVPLILWRHHVPNTLNNPLFAQALTHLLWWKLAMTSISRGSVRTKISNVTESSFKSTDCKASAFSRQEIISPAIKAKENTLNGHIKTCRTLKRFLYWGRKPEWGKEAIMATLTKTGRQCLYGHGTMAAFHIDRTCDMNKERWHVQLWPLRLQKGVSLQDAEGVLVLIDRVGIRQGLILTLCVKAGTWLLLIFHH